MSMPPGIKKLRALLSENNWLQHASSGFFLIGEGALELAVNLVLMIMVARYQGTAGLGVFTFLLSVFVFAGCISDFGISRYLEREISMTRDEEVQAAIIGKSLCAAFVTSLCCLLFFSVMAVMGGALTRVEEKVAAYMIIGAAVSLRNFNCIRVAILQGNGLYRIAAGLKTWKRLILLGTLYILLVWHVAPSYLVAGYFISELGMMLKARKAIRLPRLRTSMKLYRQVFAIFEKSSRFLFADDAMAVALHTDFFVLGIFVFSSDLGVYAEAVIMARIFLLVPVSLKPAFRKQYCAGSARKNLQTTAVFVQASTAFFFFANSVMALYILLNFRDVTQYLYHGPGSHEAAFLIFAEILPGLLFYSAVVHQEPVYEAAQREDLLQKNILFITLLNFVLNCFFIPFAGFWGAAFATSCTMFVYFIRFTKPLEAMYHVNKIKYIIAGAGVYLVYMLFSNMMLGFVAVFFLVPAALIIMFYLLDMFNFERGRGAPTPDAN